MAGSKGIREFAILPRRRRTEAEGLALCLVFSYMAFLFRVFPWSAGRPSRCPNCGQVVQRFAPRFTDTPKRQSPGIPGLATASRELRVGSRVSWSETGTERMFELLVVCVAGKERRENGCT